MTALVVGSGRQCEAGGVRVGQRPEIYVPHSQNPWSRAVWFVARTQTDPAALGSALRTEFMALDKEQPIDQLETLEQRMQNHAAEPTFQTQLMSSFALVALMLAALGIYGVNAYAERNEEMRLACEWRWARAAARCCVR